MIAAADIMNRWAVFYRPHSVTSWWVQTRTAAYIDLCLDLPVIYTFNNSSQVFVAALLISLKTVLGNSLPATTAWSLSTLLKSANARVILSPFFLPREPINVCSDSVIFDFFLRSLQAERFSVVSPPTVARRNIGCNFWQIGTVMSKILF